MNELKQNESLFRDVFLFLRQNKKWYLVPVAAVIFLMSVLLILGGTAAAPFIYTLF